MFFHIIVLLLLSSSLIFSSNTNQQKEKTINFEDFDEIDNLNMNNFFDFPNADRYFMVWIVNNNNIDFDGFLNLNNLLN